MEFLIRDVIFQAKKEVPHSVNEPNMVLKEQRGFAGLIANVLKPLNENPNFNKTFESIQRKFLINATNLKYAAVITLEKGRITVESIQNKPAINLSKKKIGWDAYIAMEAHIFLALAMKKLSLIGILKKWIAKKIKMKGIIKLLIFLKILKFLEEDILEN